MKQVDKYQNRSQKIMTDSSVTIISNDLFANKELPLKQILSTDVLLKEFVCLIDYKTVTQTNIYQKR